MCEIGTAIAIAGTLMGAGMTAYGQYESGKSQQKAAEYNAQVAEAQAVDAQRKGSVAAAQRQDQARELIARQRAVAAANGGVVDTGSNLDLFTSTASKAAFDASTIRYNAARESAGYNDQAALNRFEGSGAKNAGIYSGSSSLLAGISSAGGTYATYKYNTKLLEKK